MNILFRRSWCGWTYFCQKETWAKEKELKDVVYWLELNLIYKGPASYFRLTSD